MACARMFWQLSNPWEIPFVLLLMERVQSSTYTVILCLAQKDRKRPLSFMPKPTMPLKRAVFHVLVRGGVGAPFI